MSNTHETQQDRSWYEATVNRDAYPPLQGSRQVDVCVIGGGYTGLSAALELAQAGVNVLVLEKTRIGGGASGSNGGQLCTGMHHTQPELEKSLGKTLAADLWDIALDAMSHVHKVCDKHDIDAQFKPGRLLLAHNKRTARDLEEQVEYLDKNYNYSNFTALSADDCQRYINSSIYHGGLIDHGGGHLHPLALAVGTAKAATRHGAEICEQSAVQSYKVENGKVQIKTAQGDVVADKVVMACNGYVDKLEPYLSRRLIPANDFLIATEPLGERAATLIPGGEAVSDTRYHMDYYRISHDGRLIFGGAASTRLYDAQGIEKRIRGNVERVFPQLKGVKFEHFWSGTLGITVSQLPHVGVMKDRIYFAHGYSGLGVALANKTGSILGRAILGDQDQFDVMAQLKAQPIPGLPWMKNMAVEAAMAWYRIVDEF